MTVGLVLVTATRPARGQEEAGTTSPPTRIQASGGRLFPSGLLFRPYLADPDRPAAGVSWTSVSEVGIEDGGSTRFNLKVGGSFGLFRWPAGSDDGSSYQIDLQGGLDGIFDVDANYDNIGWDGNYGLSLSRSFGRRAAVRLGVLHTSSHIGDELIERTGRQRIDYTREELRLGGRWRALTSLGLYAEGAYGYERRNDEVQEPWRWQVGLELNKREVFLSGRGGWYVAADFGAWQERNYRVDVTLQVGISVVSGDRLWRVGMEAHDGRPSLGEFFQDNETHTAFGLWLEL